jgi:indole-3-glycerol phosphate synthase
VPVTYLDRILAAHRAAAEADRRTLDDLMRTAAGGPAPRSLTRAVRAANDAGALGVIAEVKRRSPSRGDLAGDLDPAALARSYVAGGAAAISVLTDAEFFGGSPDDLVAVHAVVEVPVLRKDFTVDARDVADARIMGADVVLLIAAALDDATLARCAAVARELAMDTLVEVHDEAEVERALGIGATLVGVNQRDLVTFEVDPERAERLAGLLPDGVVAVAESGIGGPADARRAAEAGYHAVLVGESVVTSGDPAAAVAALGVPLGG